MRLIPIHGRREHKRTVIAHAMVDDADYPRFIMRCWHLTPSGYAVTGSLVAGRAPVRMHRMITSAPDGTQVDHIDCNKLNNQRANLRFATNSQNGCNRGAQANSKTGIKGVSWERRKYGGSWRASICIGCKRISIGRFRSKQSAALAYAAAAARLHGDFARTSSTSSTTLGG